MAKSECTSFVSSIGSELLACECQFPLDNHLALQYSRGLHVSLLIYTIIYNTPFAFIFTTYASFIRVRFNILFLLLR